MRKLVLGLIGIAAVVLGWFGWNRFMGGGKDGLYGTTTAIAFRESDHDRYGLVDLDGNIIVDKEWENEPSPACEGIVRVRGNDGKYEFFTANKKPKSIGDRYKNASLFHEGLAAVVKENSAITYIDTKGATAFTLNKDVAGSDIEVAGVFRGGLARFKTADGKWGYVDPKGKAVIRPKFSAAENFHEGLAVVALEEAKPDGTTTVLHGVIDETGKEVVRLKSTQRFDGYCSNGLIIFSDNEGKAWGALDKAGEVVIKPKDGRSFGFPFRGGFTSFKEDGRHGIIDRKGEVRVRAKYQEALYLGGYAVVKDNGKWGCRDLEDNEVIKCDYEAPVVFHGGVAATKERDKFVFIDKKGKVKGNRDYKSLGYLQGLFINLGNAENELVESDFVDVSGIVNTLVGTLSPTQLNEVSAKTSVQELVSKYALKIEAFPAFGNEYAFDDGTLKRADVSRRIDIKWDGSPVTYTPNPAGPATYAPATGVKISTVFNHIQLSGKAASRAKEIFEGLKEKFTQLKLTLDPAKGNESLAVWSNAQGEGVAMVRLNGTSLTLGVRVGD